MSGLQQLQREMKCGNASGFEISRIIPEYVTDDVYGTLSLASDPGTKMEQYKVVDPNDLLVEGVEDTIGRGYEFFQLAGLALKNEASPNLYVTVRYLDDEGDEQMTVLHIIAYAWKVFMEKGEDFRFLLAIVGLLCAAGSDPKLPVTDRKILLERKREAAKDPSCVSAAEVINTAGTPKSVLNLITQSRELPTIVEGSPNEELLNYDDDYLSTLILKYIAVFTTFKGTLGDVRKIIPSDESYDPTEERLFSSNELNLSVPIREQDRADAMDLATQIGEALDDPSHMSGLEGVEKLKSCINLHANRCAELLLASQTITVGQAEDAFFEAVHSYNGKAAQMMIDNSFVPKYNHVDRILFIAMKKKDEALPISAEILMGMLVMMSEKGTSLDNQQMKLAGIISQPTFTRLSEIQLEPYWQRTCRSNGKYIRKDIRQLARTLDLDPEMEKSALCDEFNRIIQGSSLSLNTASRKLQEEKVTVPMTSIGDLVGPRSRPTRSRAECGAPSDLLPEDGTCANASQLSRPVGTFSKLDLHRIRDASNGRTYCFESVDYPTLLRTKRNEYTGANLTTMDIEAITAKYRTIMDLGLPLESESIEEGIKKLKGHGSHQDYELYVRNKRDAFLTLLNDPEIGISTELFTNEESNGGLSILQMQEIINNIGRSQNIVLSPLDNREHAIRSFALTFMEYVEEFNCKHAGLIRTMTDDQCTEALNELFGNLIDETANVANIQ